MEILLKKTKRTELLRALTVNKRKKLCQLVSRKWKSFDMYGREVQFTYKGRKSYQTGIGAFFSIVTRFIMVALAAYEFYLVFWMKHPYIYKKKLLQDDFQQGFNPMDVGFDIGFKLNQDLNNSYGQISANLITINNDRAYNKLDGNHYSYGSTPLNVAKCGESNFKMIENDKKSKYDISNYYCIQQTDINLLGSLNHESYIYLDIEVAQCKNSTTKKNCKSQSEIDSYFDQQTLNLAYINSNYDFTQVYDPIKYYVDETIELQLQNDKKKSATIFVQEAKSETQSQIFFFWQIEKQYYFEIENVRFQDERFNQSTRAMASVKIKLDKKFVKSGIIVDNLFYALEHIGGFQEIMHTIFFVMVVFFQERLFKGSFFRQLYQVKQKQFQKMFNPNEVVPIEQRTIRKLSLFPLSRQRTNERKNEITEENLIFELKQADRLSYPAIEKIYESLLARKRFFYSYRQILEYMCKCIWLRKLRYHHHIQNSKDHFYYHKADKKLGQELDILNVIRSIRKLKLMAKYIFPERSRTLLKFSRRNLIESASSSCDSDIHNYDTFKLIDSKTDLIRLSAQARLRRQLRYYQENKMDEKERELLKGIFKRRPNELDDHSGSPLPSPGRSRVDEEEAYKEYDQEEESPYGRQESYACFYNNSFNFPTIITTNNETVHDMSMNNQDLVIKSEGQPELVIRSPDEVQQFEKDQFTFEVNQSTEQMIREPPRSRRSRMVLDDLDENDIAIDE